MINKIKVFWASLPHGLQAAIVTFGTAAGVSLLDAYSEGKFSKHDIILAVTSGFAALRAFYMVPNKPQGGGN